jgi:hypothetical protein
MTWKKYWKGINKTGKKIGIKTEPKTIEIGPIRMIGIGGAGLGRNKENKNTKSMKNISGTILPIKYKEKGIDEVIFI